MTIDRTILNDNGEEKREKASYLSKKKKKKKGERE